MSGELSRPPPPPLPPTDVSLLSCSFMESLTLVEGDKMTGEEDEIEDDMGMDENAVGDGHDSSKVNKAGDTHLPDDEVKTALREVVSCAELSLFGDN